MPAKTSSSDASKKEKLKQLMLAILKGAVFGIVEGGIAAGLSVLLFKISIYAMLSIFAVWLIFGWFSVSLISSSRAQILSLLITAGGTTVLIYTFSGIPWVLISLVTGFSIFVWTTSFMTRILVFPSRKSASETPSVAEAESTTTVQETEVTLSKKEEIT